MQSLLQCWNRFRSSYCNHQHFSLFSSEFAVLWTSKLQQYSAEISNRFAALDDNVYSTSIQDGNDNIIEIVDNTNRSVIPKRRRQREKRVSKNNDNLMLEEKETKRKLRNRRDDHNYLSIMTTICNNYWRVNSE